jgi:hypothetical protein
MNYKFAYINVAHQIKLQLSNFENLTQKLCLTFSFVNALTIIVVESDKCYSIEIHSQSKCKQQTGKFDIIIPEND